MVRWRLRGSRTSSKQTETFGAGSNEQNLARAEGFRRMVEAAGQEWPDGWVKGEGFVRARSTGDPMKPPPMLAEIGADYVRPVGDLSPGQRKRYLAQVCTLATIEISGAAGPYRSLDCTVAQEPGRSVHHGGGAWGTAHFFSDHRDEIWRAIRSVVGLREVWAPMRRKYVR